MKNLDHKSNRSLVIFSFIFVLLTIIIVIAGYLSYRNTEEHLHTQVQNQIVAVANLKEDELIDWRNGRLAEAEIIRQNHDFAKNLEQYLGNPANPEFRRRVMKVFKNFRNIPEYDRIGVIGLDGQLILSDTGETGPVSASVAAHIPEIIQSKQVEMVDFYLRDADQTVRLVILVPIMVPGTDKLVGIVSMRINPHSYLFPYIQKWPVPSDSGETLLARREGEAVLTINELRFNPDRAMAMRIPLTQTNVATVKAALGQTGFVEGQDYRNEPVLADIRAVPNSPWLLITKMDIAEAYAPLQVRLWETIIFFGTLIFAVGAGLTVVWRQQGLRYYQQQIEIMTALQENQERHRQISAMISDYVYSALVLPDGATKTEWVSGAFEHITGYTLEEVNNLPNGFVSLIIPEDRKQFDGQPEASLGLQPISVEYRIRRKDGEIRWLHDDTQYMVDDTNKGLSKALGAVQDITERKLAADALRASERRLATLLSNLVGFAYRCRIDHYWTMEFVSNGCYDLTGYGVADLVGNRTIAYGDVIHPDDREMVWNVVQAGLHSHTPFQIEYRINTRHGQEKWVWEQGRGIFAGETLEALEGYITDITELKTAQSELMELNRRLEARVQERTAQVQDLYDNAPTGYHSLDANGTFVMINQTELDLLGYERDELVGVKTFRDLLPPAEQALFTTKTFPLLKNQGWVRDLEFNLLRKDGRTLPVLINAIAVYDDQGNYISSRSTMFDNTERNKAEKALRESEAQNRLLFEEAPDALVLFDDSGRLVRVNRAAETLSGYAAAQLIGKTLDEAGLISARQTKQLRVALARQNNGQFHSGELTLTRAPGEQCEIEFRVYGVEIKDRQHYLATLRDITIEKQAADTLRRANIELARAARAKDEFLANMSHELRTPLNAILNFSESLMENIYGPLSDRQQSSLKHIETAGHHLLALINDILDLSKVEAGQIDLHYETVNVDELCQASLLFVKEQAGKKALRITFRSNDQLAAMQADPKRLKQVLVNLLSNAVKFTPSGGQVSLDVLADAVAGVIRFAVRDTGIGIAPDDMDRLFQPFVQVDSSLSRQFEGTGLGLALVRRLTELHGGSITVESQPGQGSCFTLALPYHPPAVTNEEFSPTPLSARQHKLPQLALVIEDTHSTAEHLARYLQELNIKTVIHPQSQGALQQALAIQPDVIILDLLLPDETGWTVLARLKAEPRTRSIPVIIISVVDEPEKGLAAGATEYLVKPVSRDRLRQALNRVTFPLETSPEPQNAEVFAPPAAPPPPPTGAKILLAEDSEANILVIRDYLTAKGYQVKVAHDGEEALEMAEKIQPDLFLMDIQMPDLDGLEATRRLRAMPKFEATPIIALTALAMPGDKKRCIEAGANEYIAKPAVMQDLVQTIKRLISEPRRV